MSLDNFGRSSHRSKFSYIQSTTTIFPRTTDGDFDFSNRKLCNVGKPLSDSDSANKEHVDIQIHAIQNEIKLNTMEFGKLGLNFHDLRGEVDRKLDNIHMKQNEFDDEIEEKFEYSKQEYKRINRILSSVSSEYYNKLELDVYLKSLEDKLIALQNKVIGAFEKIDNKIKRLDETISINAYEGENTSGSRAAQTNS